jgi:excisionase family DNA binding protein
VRLKVNLRKAANHESERPGRFERGRFCACLFEPPSTPRSWPEKQDFDLDGVYAAYNKHGSQSSRWRRYPRTAGFQVRDTHAGPADPALPSDVGFRPRQLLTPDQLSEWLQVPKQTVYRWRTRGDGPRGYRVGKHVRYELADVEQWLIAQRDG